MGFFSVETAHTKLVPDPEYVMLHFSYKTFRLLLLSQIYGTMLKRIITVIHFFIMIIKTTV